MSMGPPVVPFKFGKQPPPPWWANQMNMNSQNASTAKQPPLPHWATEPFPGYSSYVEPPLPPPPPSTAKQLGVIDVVAISCLVLSGLLATTGLLLLLVAGKSCF